MHFIDAKRLYSMFPYVISAQDNLYTMTPYHYFYLSDKEPSNDLQFASYKDNVLLPANILKESSGAGMIYKQDIESYIHSMSIRCLIHGSTKTGTNWYFKKLICIVFIIIEDKIELITIEILPYMYSVTCKSSIPDLFEFVENKNISDSFAKFFSLLSDVKLDDLLVALMNENRWKVKFDDSDGDAFSIVSKLINEPINKEILEKFETLPRYDNLEKDIVLIPNLEKAKKILTNQYSRMNTFANVTSLNDEKRSEFIKSVLSNIPIIMNQNKPMLLIYPYYDPEMRSICLVQKIYLKGPDSYVKTVEVICVGKEDPVLANLLNLEGSDIKVTFWNVPLNDRYLILSCQMIRAYMMDLNPDPTKIPQENPKTFGEYKEFYKKNKIYCRSCVDGITDIDIQYTYDIYPQMVKHKPFYPKS